MNAEKLLQWYDDNHRTLPWRSDPTPYHVWLSEIMLQQTRVEAVREYYLRFLETLPTVADLAASPEDVCLKLWEGLGYYSRVRNLRKAAIAVMEHYNGQIPGTKKELEKLPGIGSYTASAIASIAFGQRTPSVDGNLLRVYARLFCSPEPLHAKGLRQKAEAFYRAEIPPDRPGDFNQAMMDLGATVCLPTGNPLCDRCPLSGECLAHQKGRETAYPVPEPAKVRPVTDLTVFLLRKTDTAGNVLTAVRRRPPHGLLAGLYEFPNAEGKLSVKEARQLVTAAGLTPGTVRRLPPAKHIFTHREWHMTGYEIAVTGEAIPDARLQFLTRECIREQTSVPSAFSAYMERL